MNKKSKQMLADSSDQWLHTEASDLAVAVKKAELKDSRC